MLYLVSGTTTVYNLLRDYFHFCSVFINPPSSKYVV